MHKKLVALALGSSAAAVVALNLAATSTAATTSVDLGITGSTVAGVTGGQTGQEIGFTFTAKNYSTTTSANLAITFTVTGGSVSLADYICPLISTHFNINPDTPACEPGTLSYGRSTSAGILATRSSSGTLAVKACVKNLTGATDPVSSNNCKTISVPIS